MPQSDGVRQTKQIVPADAKWRLDSGVSVHVSVIPIGFRLNPRLTRDRAAWLLDCAVRRGDCADFKADELNGSQRIAPWHQGGGRPDCDTALVQSAE